MTQESTVVALDSLVANEFQVELDGEKLTGVFRVSGLVTFKLATQASEAGMERIFQPFILTKMVQRDGNNAFNRWLRQTVATEPGRTRPRRTLDIVAVDDGVETRRWTAKGAWIGEVSYTDFDSASSEMVEEVVTIYYDELAESWPATPDLE
jgi:phage tail-like protein